MSTEQRDNLDTVLRQSAFPPTAATLGGVPIAEITTAQRQEETSQGPETTARSAENRF